MTTIKLPTVEGHEIELDAVDHAKLCAWPDLDLSQIHVVGDDALHALKPSTGKLHALTLEEMLVIPTKECNGCSRVLPVTVFPTSGSSGGYRNACASCRSAVRRAKRRANAEALEASLVAPVTGEPKGMLKRHAEKPTVPRKPQLVKVDSELVPAPSVEIGHPTTRVPLCAPDRTFMGFARVTTAAYRVMTAAPIKADRELWYLQPHGFVTTRTTAPLKGRAIRRVVNLLVDYGLPGTVEVERVAYPG